MEHKISDAVLQQVTQALNAAIGALGMFPSLRSVHAQVMTAAHALDDAVNDYDEPNS